MQVGVRYRQEKKRRCRMTAQQRIQIIRVIEKIEKNKECSERLGLKAKEKMKN